MSSMFKAYMAGVGSVAVAITLGFGGGYLIAERFGSDTAVPAQSRIEKAKQQDSKQAAAPIPTVKPVETQTVGAAGGAPSPSPQNFAPVVSVPPVFAHQQASNPQIENSSAENPHAANQQTAIPQAANPIEVQPPREEKQEAPRTAERQSAPQVAPQVAPPAAPAEQRQPEIREPVVAAQPQRKNERPPLRSERNFERKQVTRQQETQKPYSRRQHQDQDQSVSRANVVETDGSTYREEEEISANAETRPSAKKPRQVRAEERRRSREAQTREVQTRDVRSRAVEDEEQELSESAEVTTEYRRPPAGLPFLGLFMR